MSRKGQPKSIRFDDEIDAAVTTRAEEIAVATSKEPDWSAALRDFVRIGIQGSAEADEKGWKSAYADAVRKNFAALVGCLSVCADALEHGVTPEKIRASVRNLYRKK